MTTFTELSWKGEGGLALYARDYAGSGGPARCPVVCIHGLTRNSADFELVAPWIAAQGRRVLAVDIRGATSSKSAELRVSPWMQTTGQRAGPPLPA